MQTLHRHESIGLLIGAAVRGATKISAEKARAFGLASRQFWVLVAVLEADGLSLSGLSARLRIGESTASRVLHALVRRRLVVAQPDTSDRRITRFRTSPAGNSIRKAVLREAAAVRASFVAGFSPAEEASLRTALSRVIDNLDRARHSARSPRRAATGS